MEKEIGSETEMEEGTGGQKKGMRRRKETRTARWNRTGSLRVFSPFGYLFQFSKFTQDPLERQGQSATPLISVDLNPKARLVIKGT